MAIEDPLLSTYGSQLLPLATNGLVVDNREFYILGIF